MITKQSIFAWIHDLARVYKENRQYLTRLDSAIGDADHGINMDRGFTKVLDKLPDVEEKGLSDILKTVGMTLVSTVGGASGPLYGTFFMRAGMAVGDKEALTNGDVVEMFDAGLQGVLQRGKAELEDKTMVDAMVPAVNALKASVEAGESISQALKAAAEAAEQGMQATIPLQARKGRASYLGERSIGHQDPGATSTYLLFKSAAETWSDE
ncbi:MAG TPA: dihydroxyacetone kinase subunit DhaL [Aggregatilineales bacterium]|jgi:dihydroxyacetone kinase-like protein|nr:dihydroxyacetone kinase subunit L [Chloroflexota bacterium]HOA24167.1 dihydroxyacetone kinase subunit DhaL [Aggregatilineales bacterium]HPV06191.1 dihydroxyacetone kinase subunit DhaL [Aggregatilineales bacterium]HQA69344.1 dihydroxyacetone kinase subunit DhaL [Aggregatilineales bacterium]